MDAQLCSTVLVWKHNHIHNLQVPEKKRSFHLKKDTIINLLFYGKKNTT